MGGGASWLRRLSYEASINISTIAVWMWREQEDMHAVTNRTEMEIQWKNSTPRATDRHVIGNQGCLNDETPRTPHTLASMMGALEDWRIGGSANRHGSPLSVCSLLSALCSLLSLLGSSVSPGRVGCVGTTGRRIWVYDHHARNRFLSQE